MLDGALEGNGIKGRNSRGIEGSERLKILGRQLVTSTRQANRCGIGGIGAREGGKDSDLDLVATRQTSQL